MICTAYIVKSKFLQNVMNGILHFLTAIIFVHDYHAGAMTLMNRHFSGGAAGQAGQADGFHGSLAHFGKGPKGTFRSHHGGTTLHLSTFFDFSMKLSGERQDI